MASNKKILIIGIAIILVIGSVVYFVWHFWDVALFIRTMSRDKQQGQVRLLCKTDHQILLEACRELSRRCTRGELKPGRYYIGYDQDPKASSFPQPILNLKPSYVFIDNDGWVKLEMIGGLGHFGVTAYTEDYKKPSWAVYGDKELIPGLWYYDDGYIGHPEYEKRIEALMQEGK